MKNPVNSHNGSSGDFPEAESRSFDRLAAFLFVILSSLALATFYGIFSGFPKGVDAYAHLAMTKFVQDYWPNIGWNHLWYNGFPYYTDYPPATHLTIAFLSFAGQVSIEHALILFTGIALVFMAAGFYWLALELTRVPLRAVAVSLVVLSTPALWGVSLFGGASARIFSLATMPYSLVFLTRFLRSAPEAVSLKDRNFVAAAFLCGIAGSIHLQVGLILLLTSIALLAFRKTSSRAKLQWVVLFVFVVAGTGSYFFVPFLMSYPTQFFGPHVPGPVPVTVVLAPDWNVPSPVAFFLLLIGFVLPYRKKWMKGADRRIFEGFTASFLVIGAYAFLGWPQEVYVFSPWDLPVYLSIIAALGSSVALAPMSRGLFRWKPKLQVRFRSPETAGAMWTGLAALIVIGAYAPILQAYTVDVQAQDPTSGFYQMQQFAVPGDAGYRFGTDWDGVSAWWNYRHAQPQNLGFFSQELASGSQYGKRLIEEVWRTDRNPFDTEFYLEWFAIRDFVVAYPRYNFQKFVRDPFDFELVQTRDTPILATLYQFRYLQARPILTASNATEVLVFGSAPFFERVLDAFAASDFDSRSVVPIFGGEDVGTWPGLQPSLIPVVIADASRPQLLEEFGEGGILRDFVSQGGGVILDASDFPGGGVPDFLPVRYAYRVPQTIPANELSVSNHPSLSWIDPIALGDMSAGVVSDSGDLSAGAISLLSAANRSVLIAHVERGNGSMSWMGISPDARGSEVARFHRSLLFTSLVQGAATQKTRVAQFSLSRTGPDLWTVARTSAFASGFVQNNVPDSQLGTSVSEFRYSLDSRVFTDQVNFELPLTVNADLRAFDAFRIWISGDGSGVGLTVYLENGDFANSYSYTLDVDWTGWRPVVLPLHAMDSRGPEPYYLTRIEIVVTDPLGSPSYTGTGRLRVGAPALGELGHLPSTGVLESERPTPDHVRVTRCSCRGILLKENWSPDWKAQLVDANGGAMDLAVTRVGPGFMYIQIPPGVPFQGITWRYDPYAPKVGLAITVGTLASVTLPGTWRTFSRFRRNGRPRPPNP